MSCPIEPLAEVGLAKDSRVLFPCLQLEGGESEQAHGESGQDGQPCKEKEVVLRLLEDCTTPLVCQFIWRGGCVSELHKTVASLKLLHS